MPKEVRLPRLGQSEIEATIVGCTVKVGDNVKKGDVIFELEADKATLEMESPVAGFVKHIFAEVGQTFSAGELMMILGEKDEEVPRSSLIARRSSLGSRVTSDGARKVQGSQIKLGTRLPLTRDQKIIAQKMLQSKCEKPCFYLTVRVDMTGLVQLRRQLNELINTKAVEISCDDFILQAVAAGLRKYPVMTGRIAGDIIELAERINIAFSAEAGDTLVFPVIKDVDKKKTVEIARNRISLMARLHDNKLSAEDFEGACITVSNLGEFGVETFTPIASPGQCSVLGIGRISDLPVVDGAGDIPAEVRKLMNITVSVDHKVVNGAYAAQFLDFVRKLLEDISTFEGD